jgi:hypothetical protein
MMDRKGVSQGMINFFMYIAIISMVILLFYLGVHFTGKAITLKMESKSAMNEHHHTLMALLRSPATVDGETIPLSELIALATVNDTYKVPAIDHAKDFLRSDLNRRLPMMEIFVDYPAGSGRGGGDVFVINYFTHKDKMKVAEVLIPNQERELINVTLYMKEGSW